MFCLCFPRYSDNRTYFHWPNFTFSHSEQTIRPLRVNSTFALTHRHKPKRVLRRRHTLHSGIRKRKKSHLSLKTTNTAPPTTVNAYDMSGQDYSPPPGPPPSQRKAESISQPIQPGREGHVSFTPTRSRSSELHSNNPWRYTHHVVSQEPPPYNPQQSALGEEYAPPPGPPPSHQKNDEPEPPPYDPWMAVPDTALLPPPPAFHEDKSPTSNASEEDAGRADAWCKHNPLWKPRQHNQETHSRISRGEITLTAPPHTKHAQLTNPAPGRTRIKTDPKCKDTIFLSDIPLYTATTSTPKTIYFEVRIISLGPERSLLRKQDVDAALAIGFLAPPYPSWRQPGWHRGSLGVHSDDGRRYVDDPYGGQDFTRAFKKGGVVGIGMAFSPPQYSAPGARNKVEVFFTRNGKRDGGWDLHEEKDQAQDGGNTFGLEGGHDLLAAVGVFGAVEFEIKSRKEDWLFKL